MVYQLTSFHVIIEFLKLFLQIIINFIAKIRILNKFLKEINLFLSKIYLFLLRWTSNIMLLFEKKFD